MLSRLRVLPHAGYHAGRHRDVGFASLHLLPSAWLEGARHVCFCIEGTRGKCVDRPPGAASSATAVRRLYQAGLVFFPLFFGERLPLLTQEPLPFCPDARRSVR